MNTVTAGNFCGQCGSPMSAAARFCSRCRAPRAVVTTAGRIDPGNTSTLASQTSGVSRAPDPGPLAGPRTLHAVAVPAATPASAPTAGHAAYSSTWRRLWAYVIDALLLGAVIGGLGTLGFSIVAGGDYATIRELESAANTAAIVLALIALAISAAYFVGLWVSRGATRGQAWLGIRVVDASTGRPPQLAEAAKRWIALTAAPIGVLGVILPGVSLAVIIWAVVLVVTTATSPTKQGLHDRFANTVVLHDR